MVKHIVMFKLKKELADVDKAQLMRRFKQAIEALPPQIPFIRHIEVGLNINTNEQWDIVLYSEFDSLADVQTYACHPAHVAAAALLADTKDGRACVDYEI